MSRRFRLIAPAVTFAVVASILLAQKNPQGELSGTLEKLQRQLQDLQTQARNLQESLRQIARSARAERPSAKKTPLVVTSPGALPPPGNATADNLVVELPKTEAQKSEAQKAADFHKAVDAYTQGTQLEEQKLSRAAIEAFSETIRFDPANDSAYLHRSYAYAQLGDYANAASDLTKSLTIQPHNSRAYLARATAYAALGQNPLALADLDEAMLRDPSNSDSLVLRGRLYQAGGEHQKAATDFTVALSLNPESETAYLGRAVSLRGQSLMPLALADCDNAVRVNPNSPAGYLCRAESYTKTGATPQAIEQLNQAILAGQALRQPLARLNELMQNMAGSFPRENGPSIPSVTTSSNVTLPPPPGIIQPVRPAVPPPNTAPAQAANQVAIQTKAIAKDNPAPPITISVPPSFAAPSRAAMASGGNPSNLNASAKNSDPNYYARLGRTRLEEMNFQEAIKAFDEAVKRDSGIAMVYNARGYAYLRLLKYPEAIADFSEAIRLNPTYVNAYLNRSVSRKLGGDVDGANQDKAKLLEILRGSTVANNTSAR